MAGVRDRGETLVEVVVTILIVSIAVTALLSSLTTAANSSATHRRVQITDVIMRDYAEALKSATATCVPNVVYVADPISVPTGYAVSFTADDGRPGICPDASTVQILTLSVTQPTGSAHTMQIGVRTP